MTNKPKVSVLMLTYNHAKYVAKAIESIMAQKVKFGLELIIFDDASIDKTQAILKSLKSKYPSTINLDLRKKNVGMMKNYHDALSSPRGNYIALCEGDDFWTDTKKLQTQVDFLESNPDYSITSHNVVVLNQETGTQSEWLGQSHREVSTIEDIIREGSGGATCSLVFRNSPPIIKEIQALTLKIRGGDWLTQIICCKYGKMKYFTQAMATYRRHAEGATAASSFDQKLDIYLSGGVKLCERINKHLKYRYNREFRQNLANYFYPALINLYLDSQDVGGARKYAIKIMYEGVTTTNLSFSTWAFLIKIFILGKSGDFLVQYPVKIIYFISEKSKVIRYYIKSVYRYFENKKYQELLISNQNADSIRLKEFSTDAVRRSVKVHFGCGPRVLRGWVNIDLAYEPYEKYLQYYTDKHYPANIRGTRKDFYAVDICAGPLPLSDNSVDIIYHEDFIEHLTQKEQMIFLAECYRVLKPGGLHRVNTPDLKYPMKSRSDFTRGYLGVYIDVWDLHIHKNILTKNTLREMAKLVGYSRIIFTRKNMSNDNRIPLEYRPDPNDGPEIGSLFANLIK